MLVHYRVIGLRIYIKKMMIIKKCKKEYFYEVGDVVNNDLKIVETTRNKHNQKAYIVQSLIYPNAPFYTIDESSLKKGTGCAYRNCKRIYEGNSLYSVEWVRPYLTDIEEAKTIAPKSSKKIKFRCPECKQEKYISPNTLIKYGFSCIYCNKNISYPEQFFIAYSNIKNLPFKHQQKFHDFNGVFDSVNYEDRIIIELHGIQHYDTDNKWYDRSRKSDIDKRIYAKENDWLLIELDCSKSSFEYIKNSINNCEYLPNIEKDDEIRIIDIINCNKQYPVNDIISLYNKGESSYKISKITGIHQSTIIRMLSRNNIKIRDSHEMSSRKVICLNTGEIFNSISEAQKHYNISNISDVCNKKRKHAGKLKGVPLKWDFYYENK